MKEIVIMAGTADPDKRFLSVLKTLFPECAIRVVYAGSARGEARIDVHMSSREVWKAV